VTRQDNEDGQTLIIVALSMAVMLGFVAFATDVGVQLRERRLAQTAADVAAMAGASQILTSATGTTLTSNIQSVGQAAAVQNGFTNGSDGATVYVGPPEDGPYAGNASYVEATVSQNSATYFMSLFGHNALTVTAEAVAATVPGTGCIYALGTSGTGITFDGGDDIQVPHCGILDNAGLDVQSSATVNAAYFGVAGSQSIGATANFTTASPVSVPPVSDPLAYLTAPSYNPANLSCQSQVSLTYGGSTTTVTATGSGGVACIDGISIGGGMNGSKAVTIDNPGVLVINGSLSIGGSDTVTLEPGLYYITDGLAAQGSTTINATGVTLYMAGGALSIGGSDTLNLSAPTTGTYSGMAYWQPLSNTNAITILGSTNLALSGIVYAPGAAVSINGGGTTQINADFVVNSLTAQGSVPIDEYDGNSNLFRSVALVE
jgi:hypothetical protein